MRSHGFVMICPTFSNIAYNPKTSHSCHTSPDQLTRNWSVVVRHEWVQRTPNVASSTMGGATSGRRSGESSQRQKKRCNALQNTATNMETNVATNVAASEMSSNHLFFKSSLQLVQTCSTSRIVCKPRCMDWNPATHATRGTNWKPHNSHE